MVFIGLTKKYCDVCTAKIGRYAIFESDDRLIYECIECGKVFTEEEFKKL